jgi:transposase InsO family protein
MDRPAIAYPHERHACPICFSPCSSTVSTPFSSGAIFGCASTKSSTLRRLISLGSHSDAHSHHSDQGVQYASSEYVARLKNADALISMAAVGSPYENAMAESFFRTLKMEEVYIKDYRRFEEAEENIAEFIEEVYNNKRLHSSLGYLPSVEFEAAYALEARVDLATGPEIWVHAKHSNLQL